MFNSIRERIRRRRRRKSMRLRRGRGQRSASRFGVSSLGPVLKIGGLVLAVAGLVVLVIFVIVPLFGGGSGKPKPTPTPSEAATATPAPTPIAKDDMSEGTEELQIANKSVNDPYVFGREVVFSTGNAEEVSPELNTIAIYNLDSKETEAIADIKLKYTSLFEPRINEKYIVYLDTKSSDGGAVCGYDRDSKTSFVMREYSYGKPKVSLSGEYALWLQQTNKGTDKLYLYHLPTRETVVIEELVDPDWVRFSPSAAYMSDDAIVFAEPRDETKVLVRSSAAEESEIRMIPLKEGGDKQSIQFLPGTYVYDPMIDGDYLVYMNGPRDDKSDLMLCTKTGDTYSAPVLIAEGVLNYCIGDGYVAYTKDDYIYVYYFVDGSSGRVSADSTRSLLSSANGKDIVWYDITDIEAANVVIHQQVP